MSRYIEAEWLKEHTEFISYTGMWHETETDEFVSRDTIDSAPSIEIIRCQECKHRENCEKTLVLDSIYGEIEDYANLDFCSYGCRDSEKPNNSND